MDVRGGRVGVKTITISLKAYEALFRIKRPDESFSDVILRLASKHRSLMDLAGAWRNMSDEEVGAVVREVKEAWAKWTTQRVE